MELGKNKDYVIYLFSHTWKIVYFGLLPAKIIPLTQFFKAWSSEIIKVNFWAWLIMLKSIQTQENQRFRYSSLNSHAKKLVFWPVTCQNDPLNPLFQSMVQCNNWFEVLNMVKKHESLCKKRKFRIRAESVLKISHFLDLSWLLPVKAVPLIYFTNAIWKKTLKFK